MSALAGDAVVGADQRIALQGLFRESNALARIHSPAAKMGRVLQ
jgi:hypothetical protein